ncbi:hypothetical protein GGX14DRAFT_608800 [Mycena pura]|uniref:Uncharacterized protein n=1 Tax=Mycena pura TaxID=153505 RepID=A0AAD6Y143_9AGAR|nr:hypothetical protein GGX14DRAFT_608800 [Mycena pura]
MFPGSVYQSTHSQFGIMGITKKLTDATRMSSGISHRIQIAAGDRLESHVGSFTASSEQAGFGPYIAQAPLMVTTRSVSAGIHSIIEYLRQLVPNLCAEISALLSVTPYESDVFADFCHFMDSAERHIQGQPGNVDDPSAIMICVLCRGTSIFLRTNKWSTLHNSMQGRPATPDSSRTSAPNDWTCRIISPRAVRHYVAQIASYIGVTMGLGHPGRLRALDAKGKCDGKFEPGKSETGFARCRVVCKAGIESPEQGPDRTRTQRGTEGLGIGPQGGNFREGSKSGGSEDGRVKSTAVPLRTRRQPRHLQPDASSRLSIVLHDQIREHG